VQEGKKYTTIAIGCTGGRHRSVTIAERLGAHLAAQGWRVSISHRELARGPEKAHIAHRPATPGETKDPHGDISAQATPGFGTRPDTTS
jgi:UPF0042 nucleotide-binding protein